MIKKFNDFVKIKDSFPTGSFIKISWTVPGNFGDTEDVFCMGKVNSYEGDKVLCDYGIDSLGKAFKNDYLSIGSNNVSSPTDEEIEMCKEACENYVPGKVVLDKEYNGE